MEVLVGMWFVWALSGELIRFVCGVWLVLLYMEAFTFMGYDWCLVVSMYRRRRFFFLVWVVTDKFQSMKNQTEANWDCKHVSKACIEYRGRVKNAFSICKKHNKVQWLAHGDPKSTEELCAPSISSSWLIRVTYPHFTPTYRHFLLHISAYRDPQYARFARAVRRFWTRIKRVLNAAVHASISVQLLLSNFLSPNRIFNIVSISSQ